MKKILVIIVFLFMFLVVDGVRAEDLVCEYDYRLFLSNLDGTSYESGQRYRMVVENGEIIKLEVQRAMDENYSETSKKIDNRLGKITTCPSKFIFEIEETHDSYVFRYSHCDEIIVSDYCNTAHPGGPCEWKFNSCSSYKNEQKQNITNSSGVSCGNGMIKDIPRTLPKLLNIIYKVLQIAIPIILVVTGMLDLMKSVSGAKDDEIALGRRLLVKRIVMAVLVFFVFYIVKLVISFTADSSNVMDCAECLINNDCTERNSWSNNWIPNIGETIKQFLNR